MRILIACEHSGMVREAFAALGHDAWSCDLLPSLQPGQHIQADVRDILADGWDMMIVHPPCQYLAFSGMRWWHQPGRAEKREAAMRFFMQMVNAPIPRICVENPRGEPCRTFRRPDQVIHPYYFGDSALKRTCLWLKNLSPLWWWAQPGTLFAVSAVARPEPVSIDSTGKARHFTDGAARDPLVRSRTFPAVAAAMASQWSAVGQAQSA